MKPELIAQVAHEVNRAYCASIGDTSMPPWPEASDEHKAGYLAGVNMHIANPDRTPEDSHAAWLAEKDAAGWVYGKKKNEDKKTHPCMVPYDELPPEQQAKDYLFRAVVHSLNAIADSAGVMMIDSSRIPVKYIGKRPEHVDGAYGTHIHWVRGETIMVPKTVALLMLKHVDVFVQGDPVGDAPAIGAKENPDEDSQDARDMVNQMGKDQLAEYAMTQWKMSVDKRHTVEALRAQVTGYIDQYGSV